VVNHFDQLATSGGWSRLYETADGRTYHFHVRRMRVLELLPEQLGHVADIGCGPGVMVEAVLARGGTYAGIDASPEMIREAKAKYGNRRGVAFQVATIEQLVLPDGGFDQVICMAVLEYLRTPDCALREIARILRPGGTALVTVPKRWHIDMCTVAVASPIRWVARRLGRGTADGLRRLRFQPGELDAAARRANLIPDGGSQYHYTLLPYPLPRLAPSFSMHTNLRYESWHASRGALRSFFAHGFVGRYRKPN
jgi:2-polyprenyl-3-methyl-5-hydroxy-6-metoxy-1,4-benzoquinol methylase